MIIFILVWKQLRCSCRDIDEGVQYLNADIRKSSVNNSELAGVLYAYLDGVLNEIMQKVARNFEIFEK